MYVYVYTQVSRVLVHIYRAFVSFAGERFSCEQRERGMKRDEIVIFFPFERGKKKCNLRKETF